MLDFHMEREHGKRQADALLLNRKGIDISLAYHILPIIKAISVTYKNHIS